jgi:alpha-1,6-mannosyltransferase
VHPRWAGAVLMLAVAIKSSALLVLPFLVLAMPGWRRRADVAIGAVLGAIPLAALSFALFGTHLPNLQDQSTLITGFSIPNLFGLLIGVGGGTPEMLTLAKVALVVAVVLLVTGYARGAGRRGDWISHAGWATIALIASLSWLMPWYVIWVLPLAALGSSQRLRRVSIAFAAYLMLAFIPVTSIYEATHGINLLSSQNGQTASALEQELQSGCLNPTLRGAGATSALASC